MNTYEVSERLFAIDQKLDEIREVCFRCSDEIRAVLELLQKEKEKEVQ
jgi:thymidine kinase